jgi:hypothetical protein
VATRALSLYVIVYQERLVSTLSLLTTGCVLVLGLGPHGRERPEEIPHLRRIGHFPVGRRRVHPWS